LTIGIANEPKCNKKSDAIFVFHDTCFINEGNKYLIFEKCCPISPGPKPATRPGAGSLIKLFFPSLKIALFF